jgi:hypothetical protein
MFGNFLNFLKNSLDFFSRRAMLSCEIRQNGEIVEKRE